LLLLQLPAKPLLRTSQQLPLLVLIWQGFHDGLGYPMERLTASTTTLCQGLYHTGCLPFPIADMHYKEHRLYLAAHPDHPVCAVGDRSIAQIPSLSRQIQLDPRPEEYPLHSFVPIYCNIVTRTVFEDPRKENCLVDINPLSWYHLAQQPNKPLAVLLSREVEGPAL
jgi:hypothetical protein